MIDRGDGGDIDAERLKEFGREKEKLLFIQNQRDLPAILTCLNYGLGGSAGAPGTGCSTPLLSYLASVQFVSN